MDSTSTKIDNQHNLPRSTRRYIPPVLYSIFDRLHVRVDVCKAVAGLCVFLFMVQRPFVFCSFFVTGLHIFYLAESIRIFSLYASRIIPILGLCLDLFVYSPVHFAVLMVSALMGSCFYMKLVLSYTPFDELIDILGIFVLLLLFTSKNILEQIVAYFFAQETPFHGIYGLISSFVFIQVLSIGIFSQILYRYVYNTLRMFGPSRINNCISILLTLAFAPVSYFVYKILLRDYATIYDKYALLRVQYI